MGREKTIEQSKNWIIESFLDMLYIKPFSTISISEIAQNAGVDRRTFYRYFKSKDEVISYYTHEAAKEYENIMRTTTKFDNESMSYAFFSICDRHKDILKLLHKQNLLHLLLNDLNSLFQKYQSKFASSEELYAEHRSFILAYHIGGFWNLLIMWLLDDCRKTPSQMSKIVCQVFEAKQI